MANTNTRQWLAAAALTGLLAMNGATAQPKQTAEGAQKFLALLVSEGTAPAAARLGEVKVQYSTRTWEKKMLRGWVDYSSESSTLTPMREAPVERISAPDPCTTAIDALKFNADDAKTVEPADYNADYYATEARWTPSFATAMAPPHTLAWGKVTVVRDRAGVMATVPDPRFKQLSLIYRTSNPELQDRIEYAMKFLQMSCDATADTGF